MGTKIKSKFWSRRRVYERFQFIANLVTLISFIYIAVVPISSAKAVVTVNLNNAPQSMGYGTGSTCPRDPNVYGSYTDDVWHLVASQGNFLDASGNILGAVGTWNVPNIYRGMMKDTSKPAQLWMYTQHIDGVTTIMTGGTAILTDGGTKFVISHTCPGLTSNTLLTTPTSQQTFYPSTLPTSINTAASTSSLALGASLTDRADIDIKTGTAAPTGTVSFYYCYNATTAITSCTSTANLVGTSSSFTRSGTTSIYQSTSPTFVPAQAGYYAFYATYSGDGNYTGSSETDVVGETFQVTGPPTRATPTVASTAGTNPIKLGQTITDTVVVSGTNGTPTGSVTFYYCYNATTYSWTTNKCTVGGTGAQAATQIGAPVTLTSGSAVSPTFTPANAGYYSFLAVYSGDTNYLAGNDPGTNEAFTVNPLTAVTIATQASQTSIIQGGSLTDLATFTAASNSGTFGGTATFYYCQSSSTITSCNASSSPAPILIGSTTTFTTLGSPANTYTATSPTFYPSSIGNYAFYVTYSGNANYASAVATSITNETFTVAAGDLRATPTITSVAGTNPIKVGQTITDVVTITSTGTTPTGTVTFTYCYNASAYPSAASCTAGTQIGAPVTISGGTATSPNFTPTQAGFYIFHAAYSGDLNTKPGVDTGVNETFKVDALLVPTITTSASVSNLDLTGTLTDSVTVSGSGATPTGSVSFYYCFSSSAAISSVSTCASTATLIGSSNLSSGTARSPTFTPSRAGYYAFYTVYSGDGNYATANASSISGETFRVWPSSSTSSISTATSKTTLSIGGTLTDVATVVGDGFHVPTGTVTFYYCSDPSSTPTSCTSATGTQIGLPRTLSGSSPYTATSPSFTPPSVGKYRFAAVYSGDSYYSTSAETNGSNETFEVTAIPAPTITTTASTNVVLLGSSLTDQATITLASTGTAPTGTVTFYYCYNASTALTSCNSTTNLVGSTTTISSTADTKIFTATSPSFTPALLGYYAFYATYSGDSNYGSSADASVTNETFRVMPVNGTPDVTSQTSSTSVGLTNSVTDLATIAGDGVHVPTGTVTFYYCYSSSSYSWTTAGQSCSVTGTSGSAREAKQIGSPVTIAATSPYTATSSSFTPADNGYYTFLAVYSGDSYYNPGTDTGSNENFQVSALAAPTVTTSASSTSIILGNSLSDQATLSFSPDASRPTGYTKFYYCFNSTTDITSCNASNYTGYIGQSNSYSGTSPGPTFTVNSPSFTPTQTGKYAFFASFQGDTGHAAAADTSVSGETFQVSAAGLISSSITTSRSSATIGLGQSITDVATVTGSGATPTGKVTFYYCYDAVSTPTCSATLGTQIGAQITLSSGTATSASFTPTQVGFYKFFAVYSGSSTYSSSSETTGTNENFEVTALTVPTSISTTASATSVVLGNSLTDAVTVNFGQTSPTPSGTVSFYYCYNSASAVSSCTSTANLIGTSSLSISSATGTATSPSFTPRDLGYYAFYAVYNGDSNYSTKAASSVTNEQFQVVAATLVGSTTTTTAASTTLKLGNSITDTATVTRTSGSGATPTGAVTFYYCYNSTSYDWTAANQGCVVGGSGARAATQIGSPVALNGSGVAVSPSFTPGSNGYYTFYSVYSGDSIYSTSYDSGANENFLVSDKSTPTSLTTTRSSSTLSLGNSLTDAATITFPSSTPIPTGSVSFYYCFDASSAVSTCTSTANFVGSTNISVSSTTGTATSPSFTPTTAGYYAFYAVYSGDSNWNSKAAVDANISTEQFQVTSVGLLTPTVSSTRSVSALTLGNSLTDAVTVSGSGATPTGSVTFYYCYSASSYNWTTANQTCLVGGSGVRAAVQIGTPKNLTSGSVTSNSFTPASIGYYSFLAVYSGNGTYASATDPGTNENFQVNASTAVATTVVTTAAVANPNSLSALDLGTSITDSARIANAVSDNTTPTGTVSFYYCAYTAASTTIASCAQNATFISSSTTFTKVSGQSAWDVSSGSFTPPDFGSFAFYVTYSGDSHYSASADTSFTNEVFTVFKKTNGNSSTISTVVSSGGSALNGGAITLGTSVSDAITLTSSNKISGNIVYSYCYSETAFAAGYLCTTGLQYGTTTSLSNVNSPYTATTSFTPSKPGYYILHAAYQGDNSTNASVDSGANESFSVTKTATTSIVTTASASSLILGATVSDSAALTLSTSGTPTGTMSFYYCYNASIAVATCNNASTKTLISVKNSSDTPNPFSGSGTSYTINSGPFTPSATGYYAFYAAYSGDINYGSSNDTSVTGETFQVTSLGQTSSTTTTSVSSTSIKLGSSVTDNATVSGSGGTPSGNVNFYYCYSADSYDWTIAGQTCVVGGTGVRQATQIGSPVSLSTGSATSSSFTPVHVGYYTLLAVYSGDTTFASSYDSGANEAFQVTALSSPTDISTAASTSSIALSTALTDVATVTFPAAATTTVPTGTVTFYYCYSASALPTSCTSTTNLIGSTSISMSSTTGTATSPSFTPANTGYYAFYAVYNGDSNWNSIAASSVTGETFSVGLKSSTITTTRGATTTLAYGDSLTDTATVSGSGGTPSGTVTFYYCYSSSSSPTCTSGNRTQIGSPVTLSGGVAVSPSFTPNSDGYYRFQAVYNGDSTFGTATDGGTNEDFTVTFRTAPSSITTLRSDANINLGQSITDVATVSPSAATGTVSFYYCYSASAMPTSCTSTANYIGDGTLSGGSANSPSFTPTAIGYYAFYAVYNGSATYTSLAASSVTNETFRVWPTLGTATVTTTPSKTSLALGSTLTDTATIVGDGTHTPTGTVTFYYCYSTSVISSCTSGTQFGSPVTVSGSSTYTAVSDQFSPASAPVYPALGYYMFHAVYSGDTYYSSAEDSGAGETFTVTGLAATTLTTTASSSSFTIGASVYDTATINLPTNRGAPTGSVTFYYCYDANAAVTSCNSTTNSIGTSSTFTRVGATDNYTVTSPTFTPANVGYYAFYAVYGGDGNYSGSSDSDITNEKFQVIAKPVKKNSTITTAPNLATLYIGNSLTDVATVSGTGGTPTGTVNFYYCYSSNTSYDWVANPCSPSGSGETLAKQVGLQKTLSSGTATSDSFTPDAIGSYIFHAVYGGDSDFLTSSDTGSGETFMVTARPTTTISTSVSNSEFTIGGSVTDTAYINVSTVGGVAPTGTVNFYYCYDASTAITSCDSTTNLVSSTTGPFNRVGTSDTYTVTSDAFVPSAAGYYAFYATYSGNLNYSGSNETTLTNETFKVNAAIVRTTPGVATTAEVSTIKIGQSLTDAAVITGTGGRTPTGTVTFYYCYSSTAYSWTTAGHSCSVGGSGAQEARQVGTPVALVSGSATSASFTPNSIGYYTFHAVYSGDTYYLPNEDSGTGENFEVQKLPDTTITTTVSEVQIDLGHYVTDTATVTSAVAGTITGTVDFYYCYDAANDVNTCGSTSPTLSYIGQSTISSVGGNYIAVSDRFYPSEVGFYAFYAVYNGSSDYTGSNETSTANETFEVKSNVTRATPAIVTAASSSSFVLGNSVHDSATVTGVSGKNLTGMVTFYYCYSATSITSCDGKDVTQFGGSKTLPGDGTTSQSVESDDFTPTQSGYYVFHARYSGNDVYENIDDSTGAAEAFHVIDKTSTSISTTASKTSLKTGAAITDAATLTLASYAGSAPTGTMSFYYCFNASAAVTACTSTANLIGSTNTFTATGDNKVYTTVSPTFNPASEGYYSFAAVYSGDSNYAGYSDTSTVNETFKVTPDRGNATVTTSPSSTTIRIGQSLTDVATITGDGVNTVTGTVTFSYCYSGVSFAAITTPCTSGTQIGTPVTVSGGSATSPSFTPTNVGYYIFHAVYSGDTFYNSSSDSGFGETFSVIPKTNTSIDTTAGSTSILVGSTISDTATVRLVTANGAPTGTVKFYYCYKSDTSTPVASCTSTTNLISTQSTFTATADPKNYTVNSGAFTPIAVGSYAFYAVYSGDAIYSGSAETSVAGETFTVNTKPRTATAITTVPSSRSINYGDTINDVATVTTASGTPTGSVTFYYCYSATSISSCTNGTQIGSPVALSGTAPFKATSPDFTPAYGGYYMFHAVYSGDADFASSEDNGSGEDFVMIATSPTTVTTTSSLSTLALGNTVSDTAIINIGSKTVAPTGNVKFYYCYDATTFTDPCTSTNKLISTVYSPFTFVSTGNYSVNSGTFTPPNEGKYVFYAVYSGDGNYTTSADTSITNETFTVTPFTRTNTTTTTTIGSTSPIVFGQSIKDNVTVAPTTGTGTPTGTVTFFYCYSSSTYNWVANPCSVGGSGAQEAKQFGSPVTLSAGKATSQSFVPAAVGFYSFHAEYSGDATYNSSIDTGAGENFEVSKYTTTLTTKASNTTLTFGNSITDVATISVGGGVNDPTGTVTFSYCFSSVAAPTIATCPTWTNFDTQSTFTANADGTGYVATSKSFTPAAVGYYLFHAAYSGDSTYSSSEDNGVNENFRVLGNIASTTTTSASATNITLGQQVRDNVTVTGTGSQIPTGTVTFSYCYSLSPITSCTSGTALGSAVALSPSTTPTAVATSILFTPTRAGYYMFHAVYGGDAYYLTSQDAGTNESFFVTGKSTTITTVSSSTSINLGSTISDMATLNIGTGTVAPTGNVKFYYCYDPVNPNINCSSTTNYFGQSTTFTNTSGSLYTIASPTFTPNAAGNYAFYAVYSGDGNYATSADTDATWERFVVVDVPRTTPTVTTQASASTIKLGDSITDIATVTGTTGVPVTGTVIFSYCYSATSITSCTGLTTTQIGSPVTLSATAPYRVQSPVFTPDTGGYYVFKATYSGSSRYTIASDDGTNENFFVSTPTNTTITTAASLSTFALGVSNTDVVTLDVGSGTAIPSGSVTFYYCFDDTNVITTCNSTANRVGSSTTFNYVSGSTYTITSPIFTPTKVGNYVYYAVYSGDANYKGSTDGSTTTEAFSVTEPELRATPTVATTASKSTLAIGDSLTDAVTVTGDGSNIPSGTVTFYYCYSTTAVGTCATANATQIGDPVILDNEGKATSPTFTPSKGGYYKFHAVYSGDTNFKDAVDPSAASEAFVVSAISTSITTTASTATLDLGGTITDVATIDVGSGTQDPTGSVSFYYCYQSDTSTQIAKCDASTPTTRLGSVSTFVHTVGSLYNVTSPVFTPALAGNYAFFAVYSGDSTYNESSDSDISHELFTVSVPAGGDTRANSQVDTTASVNTLNLGESVYDNALVSQVAGSPLMIAPVTPVAYAVTDPTRPLTGTLTWYYCYNPSSAATGCNSTIGTQFSDPIPVGYGTSTVQSPSFTPSVAGYYAFHAVYSGDGSYKMAYDPSGASEQFLVKGGSTPPGGGGGTPPGGGGYTPPSTPDKSPEKPTPGKPGKTSIQGDVPSWIKTGFSRLTNSSATPTPIAEPSTTPAPKKATTTPKTTTSKKPVVKAKPTPTKPFKFPVAAVPNVVFDPAKCNLPMGKSRTAGQVNYRGTHVRVIPITYPKGGVLTPPPYTDVAAISVRHQPISATEGSTLIVWHVDWNGCVGALDPLANSHIGDTLNIVDENGVSHILRITANFNVPKGKYQKSWFMLSGKRQFIFVTCAGKVVNYHYLDNKIIMAVPVN